MGDSRWHLFVSLSIFCLALRVDRASCSQDIMKKLTAGFSEALEKCKNELNVGDHILQDFYNFWREDYELVNREMGCVVMCMASKFDLINEELKLHHGNAHQFAKTHGADDTMAQQLVTMIHDCEKNHVSIADDCSRVLEISKCFRTKIHELKWAPSMEVVLEEVMTEM
uniref:Pheromone binding protein 1 n=1 Tax=Conopomorpha sinensis TaxID=940481 RepID=A0A2Z4EJF6_9NEOP|nr:pheromone binding protein 1 [Conopomorpha sinensis]